MKKIVLGQRQPGSSATAESLAERQKSLHGKKIHELGDQEARALLAILAEKAGLCDAEGKLSLPG